MNETFCANEVIRDGLSGRGMEDKEPEQSREELQVPANTAASPEESKSSIQEPSKGQEFESQPEPQGFTKDLASKPYPEGLNKDPGRKPDPEGFNQETGRKPYTEGFNENSDSKPYPEGRHQDSGSKSSTIREVERYKPVDEAVLKELKDLESSTSTSRTSTSSPSKGKSCRRSKGWAMAGQKMCKCAASSAADCAAVCCCPCVLAHLLVLALVKVPSVLAMKAFRYTKRKARIGRKKKSDAEDQEEDGSVKKIQSYKSGWSLSVTPHFSGPMEGSPARTAEQQKAENQKFWQDLYAGGHMGFGGPALERD